MKLYKNLKSALAEPSEVRFLKLTLETSEIPPELFFFENLEELYLEGAATHFPKLGSPWKQLRVLSLKLPKFDGGLAQFFQMSSLENLKVIDTPLKGLTLPLGHVGSRLIFLTLKNNGLRELPEEISMLSTLKELSLLGNELSHLPHSFSELRNLKRLNLDDNHFEKFPEVVMKMPNLSHLSIDRNQFSEREKERVQREFKLVVN